jgi:hypothetical protein
MGVHFGKEGYTVGRVCVLKHISLYVHALTSVMNVCMHAYNPNKESLPLLRNPNNKEFHSSVVFLNFKLALHCIE